MSKLSHGVNKHHFVNMHTISAASLMNCFAPSVHIAGTVNTHLMSVTVILIFLKHINKTRVNIQEKNPAGNATEYIHTHTLKQITYSYTKLHQLYTQSLK